jgi:hypothetical protein
MTRYIPRFTLRTLAIVVTLVCAYVGLWEETKRYGVPSPSVYTTQGDFERESLYILKAYSPLPLIVIQHEFDQIRLPGPDANRFSFRPRKRVYLWLVGPKIRLFTPKAVPFTKWL